MCGRCVLLVMLICAACAKSDDVDRSMCERYRDHLIDLRFLASDGSAADLAPHRAAMKHAMGDSFLETCEKTLKANQLDCALAATEPGTATACISH